MLCEIRGEKGLYGLAHIQFIHHAARMKIADLPKIPLLSFICSVLITEPSITHADAEQRIFVVEERATASLHDGTFTFKVLKINGYTIVIKTDGEKRTLKIGQSFSSASANCSVVFEEIKTEAPIAQFKTNCP